MLPIEHFSPFVILLHILDPPVLRNNEPVPIRPIWVLHLHISILIGISLLETYQFVQIREHIDEHTALVLPLQEVINSKLDAVLGLEDINHLADNVLEIEI